MSGQPKKDNVRRKLKKKKEFIVETERSISKDGPYNAYLVYSGQVLETGTVRWAL
jgi:hypothetical protein